MKSDIKKLLFLGGLALVGLFTVVGILIATVGLFLENHTILADFLLYAGIAVSCLGALAGFALSAPKLFQSFLYICILQIAKIFAKKVL
jgi:hypothetical protein